MLMIKSLFSPKNVKLHPNGNIHIPHSFKSLLSLCIGMFSIGLHAADTVFVKTPQVPILIERHDNVLAYLRLDAKETKILDNVTISFDKNVPLSQIKAIKLYYGGTEAPQDREKKRFAPVEYISSNNPGQTLSAKCPFSAIEMHPSPDGFD